MPACRSNTYSSKVSRRENVLLLGQPFRCSYSDPWRSTEISSVVLFPEPAPPCVHQNSIAGLQAQVLPGQCLLQIVDSDLVRCSKHLSPLQTGHIDQHATRERHAHFLNAKLRETGARSNIIHLHTVVHGVAHGLVSEAVELCSHLSQLRDNQFFVAASPIGRCVHESPLGMQIKGSRTGQWHRARQNAPQLENLTCADQARRPENRFRLLMVH